jgi:uncharacterized protein YqeY
MKLQDKIIFDLTKAMLTKDDELKSFLRFVLGDLNREGRDLSDSVVIKILKNLKKDAIVMNNQYEIKILDSYLPVEYNKEHITEIVLNTIKSNSISMDISNFGKIMGLVKKLDCSEYINGKLLADVVKSILK